jgi:hypothetical protein
MSTTSPMEPSEKRNLETPKSSVEPVTKGITVSSRVTDEEKRLFPYYAPSAIMGIRLISALDDVWLWKLYYEEGDKLKPFTAAVRLLMGSGTNLSWIHARAADELFNRRLIRGEDLPSA